MLFTKLPPEKLEISQGGWIVRPVQYKNYYAYRAISAPIIQIRSAHYRDSLEGILKVAIIDSSSPEDFFSGTVDSILTQKQLDLLGIESKLRVGLDKEHFAKALRASRTSDVVHISCHGEEEKTGICLGIGGKHSFVDWEEFVQIFQTVKCAPSALVMSACFGGDYKLARLFAKAKHRPSIIFGSREGRPHADYTTAWAILYRILDLTEIDKDESKRAVGHINGVLGDGDFVYRRWDTHKEHYRVYPTK